MNLPRCIHQTQCIPKNHLVKKTSISLQGPRVPLFLESVRKLRLRTINSILSWATGAVFSTVIFSTSSFVWQVAGWLCRLGWQSWQTSWDIEEHFPTSVLQLNFKWLCPAMSIVKNATIATHIICVLYVMCCSYCISSYHAIIQSQRSHPNHSDTTPTTLPEFADFSRMLRFARHFHEDFIMKRHRANPED